MMDVKQNYHAITLDKRDVGETDRFYTFYTHENGLMRVLARSIRKSDARLASQVEDFMLTHITIAKKNGYGILAGAVAEEYFSSLRSHYYALSCIDKARHLFLSSVREHEPDQEIFLLLSMYLHHIEHLSTYEYCDDITEKMDWMTNAFAVQLFGRLGYIFHVKSCCLCHDKMTGTQNGFSAYHGGVLCDVCVKNFQHCLYIDVDTIKSLRVICDNHFDVLHKLVVHRRVNTQLFRVVDDIERWVMR